MSWSFINDSLATTLCLQWEPEIVACAVLYLATRMSKFTIEDWEGRQPGQRWWECFVEGMSTEVSSLTTDVITFLAVSVLCAFYSGQKLTPTAEHMSQFEQASDITGS